MRSPSPFREAARAPLLQRLVPLARDLRGYGGYGGDAARHDVVAGLTVAALAIPSGMAYASLAGLTPVIGLYTLLLPVVAYAVLGSSRQVAVGPEGSLAALAGADGRRVLPADAAPEQLAELAVTATDPIGQLGDVLRDQRGRAGHVPHAMAADGSPRAGDPVTPARLTVHR